jgi:hypothetical protein
MCQSAKTGLVGTRRRDTGSFLHPEQAAFGVGRAAGHISLPNVHPLEKGEMPCASLRIAADMPILSSPRSWRSFLRPAQRNHRRGRRRSMRCTNGCTGRSLTAADRWRYRLPLPQRPTNLRLRDSSLTRNTCRQFPLDQARDGRSLCRVLPIRTRRRRISARRRRLAPAKTGAAAGSELRRGLRGPCSRSGAAI